jgi:hypothetical protein
MAMPPAVIDANQLPLMPVRNGLFVEANGPMPLPEHAQTNGLLWQQEVCGAGHLYPPACLTPPYQAFTYDTNFGPVQAYPFVVYASEVCGIVPNEVAEVTRRLRNRLRITEQAAVEKALWGGGDGVTGVFEQLQALTLVDTLAASANLTDAVSLLEQQATTKNYFGPITLHARPRLAAYMSTRQLIRPWRSGDGDHRYTQYGSCVVFGAGYSGNLPDGTVPSATAEAIYATGRIHLWQEPEVFVSPPNQVLNRATNQRGIFALRAYALAVECFASATLVTRA